MFDSNSRDWKFSLVIKKIFEELMSYSKLKKFVALCREVQSCIFLPRGWRIASEYALLEGFCSSKRTLKSDRDFFNLLFDQPFERYQPICKMTKFKGLTYA